MSAGLRNHRSGHVEDANLNGYSFDSEYNAFDWCVRPGGFWWPGALGLAGRVGLIAACRHGGVRPLTVSFLACWCCLPPARLTCRSHGVAADPEGTGVVRHRDLVASGAPSLMGPPSTSGQPPKRLKTDKVAKQQQQQQQQAEFDPSVVSEGGAAAAAAMTSLSGMRLLCCGGLVATVFSPAHAAAAHGPQPAVPGLQPFTLRSRQPWADKAASVSELTEEQKEYMEAVRSLSPLSTAAAAVTVAVAVSAV